MAELTLTRVPIESEPDVALLEAAGVIDMERTVVRRTFDELRLEGKLRVVIDCVGVRSIQAPGTIDALVEYADRFAAEGGGVALLGVHARHKVVLEMLGYAPHFAVICSDRPTALAAVKAPRART